MIDVLDGALRAVSHGSPLAIPLLLAAGVATSIGPCTAPRYVAVAALANASSAPWRVIGAFVCGLTGAYVAIGLTAGALGTLFASAPLFYVALAVMLGIGGIATLLRGHRDGHRAPAAPAHLGAPFLLGGSSALIVSPCCTPIVAGIAGLTIASGNIVEGVLLIAAFSLGHAAPLLAAGAAGRRAIGLVSRFGAADAPAIVGGTLMLALAAFYGVLA